MFLLYSFLLTLGFILLLPRFLFQEKYQAGLLRERFGNLPEPVMKGATASNSNKPATLENGVTLYVPPFMTVGEKIRVNPSESKYMERVK